MELELIFNACALSMFINPVVSKSQCVTPAACATCTTHATCVAHMIVQHSLPASILHAVLAGYSIKTAKNKVAVVLKYYFLRTM